jgi:hypothetical protein
MSNHEKFNSICCRLSRFSTCLRQWLIKRCFRAGGDSEKCKSGWGSARLNDDRDDDLILLSFGSLKVCQLSEKDLKKREAATGWTWGKDRDGWTDFRGVFDVWGGSRDLILEDLDNFRLLSGISNNQSTHLNPPLIQWNPKSQDLLRRFFQFPTTFISSIWKHQETHFSLDLNLLDSILLSTSSQTI